MIKAGHFLTNHLTYTQKKEKLIAALKQHAGGTSEKISLYKNTSNVFRAQSNGRTKKKIDVRNFNQVLHIDKEKLIAEVEGMTSYEDLIKETLKYDCLPTIVPELKSITIGGALSGCGIESSSFRYGLVHETITATEILLSNGSIINCTPENEHSDLFYAFPNTYGTMGYALKVQVKLIPTKKYVKIHHQRFSDPIVFFKVLNELCSVNRVDGSFSFIDGVVFNRLEMYITTGTFVDEAPFVNSYRYLKMYYRSIREMRDDYLTTQDYIWRWDTDWFWCSKVFFMQNFIMRLLLGKWMLTSKVYTKMMNFVNRHPHLQAFLNFFQKKKESVIQDVLIPIHKASEFLDFFLDEIGITPLWICPSQAYSKEAFYPFCPLDPDQLYIDFGFWDAVVSQHEDGYYNRKIENQVRHLGGFKSLYSSSYYTENEFWELYNRSKYLHLKQKYDSQGVFGDLYKKCVKPKS